jgi:hypothetical protein
MKRMFLSLILAVLLALLSDTRIYAQFTDKSDTIENTVFAQAHAVPGEIVNRRYIWQGDIDWARRKLGIGEPEPEPAAIAESEPAPVLVPVAIAEPEPAPLVPVAIAEPEPAPVPEPVIAAEPVPVAAQTLAGKPKPEPKPKKPQKPRKPLHDKYFEIGVDANAGFANSHLAAADLLKKTVELDLDYFGENDSGFSLFTAALAKPFINIYINNDWGFGLRAGVDVDVNANIPQSLMEVISRGNSVHHRIDGDVTASGSVFASAEVNVWGKIKGIKAGISPAFYVPLVYVPQSIITYNVDSHSGIIASAEAYVNVYTPVSIERGMDILNDMNMETINSILSQGGVDFSLFAEYPFLENLDAGVQVRHIPLWPALLTNRMTMDEVVITVDAKNPIDAIDKDISEAMKISDIAFNPVYESGKYPVLRPLRVDLYAVWRPFTSNIFSLRPHLGFSFITTDKKVHISGGFMSELNLWRIFMLRLAMGYDETVWKHSVNLEFNLRVLDFYVEAQFMSQDFINSFRGGGVGLATGVKIGF